MGGGVGGGSGAQNGQDFPLDPFKQPLDNGGARRMDIPAPDPALAPSFDADPSVNAHRYRYLENNNGWICRALVEPDGLEHDDGIYGFNVENSYGLYVQVKESTHACTHTRTHAHTHARTHVSPLPFLPLDFVC